MTMKTTMKPETIARRAKAHELARAERRQSLVQRLTTKAAQRGADSIWAEMLAEMGSR